MSGLSPDAGWPGNTVQIGGSGFGTSAGAVQVTFGGAVATVVSVADAQLVVTAPAHAAGAAAVAVSVGGVAAASSPTFTYREAIPAAPQVSGLSPDVGAPGASVTIAGSGFGTSAGAVQVTFGGAVATVVSVADGQLVVTAPAHAAGAAAVAVSVGGVAAASSPTFTYREAIPAAPQVSGLSPDVGAPGASVTIAGSGFGTSAGAVQVTFGGAVATVVSVADGQLVVTAPAHAAGAAAVAVSVGGVAAATSPTFTYREAIPAAPQVSGLSPEVGAPGASVTIAGSGFGTSAGAVQVTFGGAVATVVSVADGLLVVTAPAHAAGAAAVAVSVGGVAAASSPAFTYREATPAAPQVSGLSPDVGAPGASVTIAGSGFGTSAGAVQVTFGGAVATVVSVADAQLVVTAPAHAAGAAAVAVSVGGVAAASSPTFTYREATPAAPQVSGLSPAIAWPGQPVTITGANFSTTPASNTVKFGDLTAQVTAATATQLTVVAPPYGAGTASVTVTVGGIAASTSPAFTFQSQIEVTKLASLPADAVVENSTLTPDYAAFAVGGRGYVVNSAGVNYQYDTATNAWTQKARLSTPRQGAWGFTIGSLGYVGFGDAGYGKLATVVSYDPGSDTWATLNTAGSIPIAGVYRPHGTLIALGNQVIVGNGASARLYTGTISGGTLTWSETLACPDSLVANPIVFSNASATYWGGGALGNEFSTTFYRLESEATGAWTPATAIPGTLTRSYVGVNFVIGDAGYVVNRAVMWKFDLRTQIWKSIDFAGVGGRSWGQATFTIGDTAYVLYADGSLYSIRDLGPNPYAS